MKPPAALVSLACLLCANAASAQTVVDTLSVEASQTVGASSEDVSSAATQLHLFGELTQGIRFNVETGWAWRSVDRGDALQTAYPYDSRLKLIEAYGERVFDHGHGLLAVRVGRYRTPFGIYSASDHGY